MLLLRDWITYVDVSVQYELWQHIYHEEISRNIKYFFELYAQNSHALVNSQWKLQFWQIIISK